MNDISLPAVVATALHRVFASSPHAPDSLEMWLAVTAEATHQLTTPTEPAASQWLPMFTYYDQKRIGAEYNPVTAAVRITSGPLTGITYPDPDSACRAIVTAYATPAPDVDIDSDGDGEIDSGGEVVDDDMVELMTLLPTWRLSVDYDPAPHAQPHPAATR
ncbi:hypothetical protein [Nocardia anaemiae]|uniref:hypothetical protein n=1 Tax=Nocardia anaemiae TaxID=263910 RepID=UPI0007A3A429|nr:hypothetical protein [Nocardia anaemiae]